MFSSPFFFIYNNFGKGNTTYLKFQNMKTNIISKEACYVLCEVKESVFVKERRTLNSQCRCRPLRTKQISTWGKHGLVFNWVEYLTPARFNHSRRNLSRSHIRSSRHHSNSQIRILFSVQSNDTNVILHSIFLGLGSA